VVSLDLLKTVFAIVRLNPADPIPDWAAGTELLSITRTPEELSIVCNGNLVPAEVQCQRGWRCFKVDGPLDFSLVGVLASIAGPLASAQVSIFVVATFDTDYVLVTGTNLDRAIETLEREGHVVRGWKS
jgi:uncharacterized protein